MPLEILLTVEQAAARLQMHPDSVRRQLKRGQLRGVKRGTRWRVPESAVEESTTPELQRVYTRRDSLIGAVAEVEEPGLTALFAPPTPAEIARRLAALDSIKHGAIAPAPDAPTVDLEADPWGYEERADNLMESRQ
jgi:excisionase family DNA binding protein